MGSVYRGERLKLGRAVAIKIMHQELPDELSSRQRFEREAKLMALLEHPNCVSVIDYGLHEDKPFLIMDLVRGTSLLEVLDKEGKLEPQRAADIIRQVLSGLSHAHELGIVHRDVKPANIMISDRPGMGQQVRILDFGLARLTESNTKLTTGIVVGTPNYMAPEQCKGGDIDARTDLYSCGVMLFEMLTGRKPFLADDPIQVVRKHLLEKPPTLASALPDVDFGDLEQVVAKALSKAAKDRFESAVEMSKAVQAAIHKKMSAAAMFARAVPASAGAMPHQQATMSGWTVPADPNAEHVPPAPAAPPHATDIATPAPASVVKATPPHGAPTAPAPVADTAPARSIDPVQTLAVPDGPLIIPPTRPSTGGSATAIPQLPFTRRQLMIAGAGVFALVILIAIIAGGGSKKKKTDAPPKHPDTPAVVKEAAPKEDPLPKLIERGKAMLEAEQYEDAAAMLKRARKAYPDSAELAFLAGKANFKQLWWSDGVDNFRDAIKLDDSYRNDPDLLKTVLKGFLTTPDIDDVIRDFMRHDLGPAMRPYLEETAEKHPKKALRARARAELNAQP